MRKKAVKRGMITRGPLAGLRAELVRYGLSSVTVRLVDGWKVYKPGDVVNLGSGEFSVKADGPQTPEKG
jgi:hypothetical protein